MFSSILDRIRHQIETYDKYGEYRINALKGVYIFFILAMVNMIYGVSNPYFNFFYLPLTALTAEMVGETKKSKYWLFFHVTMGAIIAVFLFNILVPYPLFFVLFVFVYSFLHYIIALHVIKNIFFPIPIVLSLAAYSLVYGEINTDIYIALNNALISLIAMFVIMAALLLFPSYYYFKAWWRAYILLLKQILENLNHVQNNQPITTLVRGHFIKVIQYSQMLSRKFPIFSILKINVLVNELRIFSSVIDQEEVKIDSNDLNSLIANLNFFIESVEKKSLCSVSNEKNRALQKMIYSWNYLCSNT
jgi:hypothetical protein